MKYLLEECDHDEHDFGDLLNPHQNGTRVVARGERPERELTQAMVDSLKQCTQSIIAGVVDGITDGRRGVVTEVVSLEMKPIHDNLATLVAMVSRLGITAGVSDGGESIRRRLVVVAVEFLDVC